MFDPSALYIGPRQRLATRDGTGFQPGAQGQAGQS